MLFGATITHVEWPAIAITVFKIEKEKYYFNTFLSRFYVICMN